jgi:hypothetical protein
MKFNFLANKTAEQQTTKVWKTWFKPGFNKRGIKVRYVQSFLGPS